MKYLELLKSDIWKIKKNNKLNKVNNCCEKCWEINNLQLHHSHYEWKYWNEKQKSLYILCNSCHLKFHNIYWTKRNMVKETREFLWLKQSYIFITKELLEYAEKWWKFKQQSFTKSVRTRRAALKYIKDPIKYQDKFNFI